jgi:site-specific DNA-methyltransferase (adenine-specific)
MTGSGPSPAYRDELTTVYLGDCLEILPALAEGSIDALVTDPPAGIGFMGNGWDHFDRHRPRSDGSPRGRSRRNFVDFMTRVMAECWRLLKPGGHALVWAIPRTSHWTATAIEDAGFEVRDVITHHFGTGFPKSRDVSKATGIGAERSRRWLGWGTGLKPASEHWILARKPLAAPNAAANVLAYGTGALNIDGCRIASGSGGRWPANLILSHSPDCDTPGCVPDCPIQALDRQSGSSKTRRILKPSDCGGNTWGGTFQIRRGPRGHTDEGGASRFFYVAKPSTLERDAGLDGSPLRLADPYGQHRGRRSHDKRRFDGRPPRVAHNHHPTVKSVVLMRYLCTLITPPGGTILDCFAGSGSTLVAAKSLGFHVVGIERDPDYVEIIRRRVRDRPSPAAPASEVCA